MKRVLTAVLGASLLLAGCGQQSAVPNGSTPTPYTDGLDHSWTASTAQGQQLYAALSSGLKAQDFSIGLSVTATSGYGPIELNTSNGEFAAGDGHPITLNGQVYSTGLGVHADSEIHIHATNLETPACTRFQADVGIDDEVGDKGSVVFQVYADGVKLFDSGVMTGASATQHIDVGIGNKSDLRFVVTNGGDNYYYDHADWAGATLTCTPTTSVPAVSDGSLDASYGTTPDPEVQETAVQGDGKLLEFGMINPGSDITKDRFFLRRLNQKGEVDSSFGAGGQAQLTFSIASRARRLLVQPDGKILAMGRASLPKDPTADVSNRGFVFVARYLSNGTLDSSFGNSMLPGYEGLLFAPDDAVTGLALSPNGQIVLGGTVIGTDGLTSYVIRRYQANGQPDESFGDAGVATLGFPDAYTAQLNGVAVQTDGKIVVFGTRQTMKTSTAPFAWTVARLNQDGKPDPAFASSGLGTYGVAPLGSSAQDLKLLADGALLLAGETVTPTGDACSALRVLPNGLVDSSFSSASPGVLNVVDLTLHRVTLAVQTDGKAILGGCRSADSSAQPGLIRFNTDGSQDLTFGTRNAAGVTVAPVPDSFNPLVQPGTGEKILVGLTTISRVNP